MKAVIVNDTGIGSHAGCILTMATIRRQCQRVGINVIGSIPRNQSLGSKHTPLLDEADLVIVNGEGSLHDNHRNELIRIADVFPSVLINTVYQNNITLPEIEAFLYCAVRESKSAAEFPRECEVVPDVCFSSDTFKDIGTAVPVYDVGVTDSVICSGGEDITIKCPPLTYATKLRAHKRIATGRFHGAVFCAMLDIPFSAYPSNTHKIKGMLTDMGIEEHYHLTKATAVYECPERFNPRIREYVINAKMKIDKMFEHIAGLKL